ncbi:MAG: demethoxyubiquinone hydroxylase family protein [Parvularculaceae bacterium]
MSGGFDKDRMTPGPRQNRLAEMLRVDHAGEHGAVTIYRGQRAVFDALPGKAALSARLREMEEGEAEHLETFNRILAERGVRPTLLSPLWSAAGFGLGAVTALMGEKAAMACTAAVEEVIEKHYSGQAEALAAAEPDLTRTILEFRDDELEHKRIAEEGGAEQAPAYPLLKAVIQAGCRAAIRLSEKI